MASADVKGDMRGIILADWFGLIGKYGFAAGIAVALLGYMAFYVVAPMRDDQKAFMLSVIKTNEINAATHAAAAKSMEQLTAVQQTQAVTLNSLTDQQRQQTAILQQIRDDQRSGAWRDAKGAH